MGRFKNSLTNCWKCVLQTTMENVLQTLDKDVTRIMRDIPSAITDNLQQQLLQSVFSIIL